MELICELWLKVGHALNNICGNCLMCYNESWHAAVFVREVTPKLKLLLNLLISVVVELPC